MQLLQTQHAFVQFLAQFLISIKMCAFNWGRYTPVAVILPILALFTTLC